MAELTPPSSAICWRCKGEGFVREPCQACGRLKVADGVARMAGSIWPDEERPLMRPKTRRTRVDR